MFTDTWNKFIKNFKILSPCILVLVALDIITFIFSNETSILKISSSSTSIRNLVHNFTNDKPYSIIITSVIIILLTLFISPLIHSFIKLIVKKCILSQQVCYIQTFKESLHFYLKYLVLDIILLAIYIGITLLLFLGAFISPIIFILGIFLVLYLTILLSTCESYLIYYDSSVKQALSLGLKLGKKHFWELFFLCIGIGFINKVLNEILKTQNNKLIFCSITIFIFLFIKFYSYVFFMNICRIEEKTVCEQE